MNHRHFEEVIEILFLESFHERACHMLQSTGDFLSLFLCFEIMICMLRRMWILFLDDGFMYVWIVLPSF
jgi:uncharacterized membrane protein YobD (UPF0266 family)